MIQILLKKFQQFRTVLFIDTIIFVLLSVLSGSTLAQSSQDIKGKDFSLIIQQGDNGKYLATGGLTAPPGETQITIGDDDKYAGFWEALIDTTYTVSVYSDTKSVMIAILELKKVVRWDKDGKLTEGKENFLRIKFLRDEELFKDIVKREFHDGYLTLSTDSNVLILKRFYYKFGVEAHAE